MKKALLFLLAILYPGCIAPVRPAVVHNECERETDTSTTEYLRILNKGFDLEDLSAMTLRDDESIIRLYEDMELGLESVIQVHVKNGDTIIEMRTSEMPIKVDMSRQYWKAAGNKGDVRSMTAKGYTPKVDLHIERNLGQEKLSSIRRFITHRDLFHLKNIYHCYEGGEEILRRDGVSYTLEIKKGNRRHLVRFWGEGYTYEPYMEVMALFGEPGRW